jgi:hypothetical protein
MRRSGWEAPTYPSFDFRQSADHRLCALIEARFSAHASSSGKRYRTRTVGRFSIPESLAPPHVRARPRGTVAKSPFYSKKVAENQISPSYKSICWSECTAIARVYARGSVTLQ